MSETVLYRNALPAGSTLLEYRLESVLGAGGFGMTYLARDVNLDKAVAIKEYFPSAIAVRALDGGVLSTGSEHNEGYQWGLQRFLQEARTLARFTHPHIVRVNRYFEANGTGYMVMDYEEGESLHQLLKREPALPEQRVRELLLPLLDGLDAVHQAGFLHRDIKPSNIFVRKSGSPVLLDFGSARAAPGDSTKTLTAVLTPGYAPLEQYSGDGHQGPWTDLYALGGVLYRVFTGDNPPDAVSRLKSDLVPAKLATLRGRISQPVLRAVEWALALDEKNRPQSVPRWRQVLLDTSGAAPSLRAAASPAPARPVTPQPPAEMPARAGLPEPRRRDWQKIANYAKYAFLAVLLVTGYTWFKRNVVIIDEAEQAQAEALQAQQERERQARAAEEARRARIARDFPASLEIRSPDPAEVDTRSAERQAREQRMAKREAALRQYEAARAGGQAGAAPKSDSANLTSVPTATAMAAAPTPAPGARDQQAPSPSLEAARQRDPLAAQKEAAFKQFDADGDGQLTPQEAAAMPGVGTDFHSIDRNGDGRITLEEFFHYRPLKPPKP